MDDDDDNDEVNAETAIHVLASHSFAVIKMHYETVVLLMDSCYKQGLFLLNDIGIIIALVMDSYNFQAPIAHFSETVNYCGMTLLFFLK